MKIFQGSDSRAVLRDLDAFASDAGVSRGERRRLVRDARLMFRRARRDGSLPGEVVIGVERSREGAVRVAFAVLEPRSGAVH